MASPTPKQQVEHPDKEVAKDHQGSGSDQDVPVTNEPKRYQYPYDDLGPDEGLSSYKPGGMCPVDVGDKIYERYKILGKRDYDLYYNSWIARDLKSSKLVQLDIFTAKFSETAAYGDSARNFRAVLEKIEGSPSEIKRCFQDKLNEIWIDSANGRHLCQVLELAVVKPGDWTTYGPACFPAEECRNLILTLMRGLCELHDQGFVHREINIFSLVFVSAEVSALSDDQLSQFLEDPKSESIEAIDSSLTSEINLPRAIYYSNNNINDDELMKFNRQPRLRSAPPLQKIGEIKTEFPQTFISDPDCTYGFYSAPENIGSRPNLRATASANVWSAACVIYEIVTGNNLFNKRLGYDDRILGQLQSTLGDIPNNLRREWGTRSEDVYFTLPFLRWFPRSSTLSERIRERLSASFKPSIPPAEADPLFSDEEHDLLADLLTKMLEYDPSKRITTREALNHPWFSVSS